MCGNDLQHNSLSMRQLKMSEKENSVGWVKIRNWALGQWGTRPLNFYSVSILIFLFKKFGSEKLLTIIGGHIPPNKFAPMLWFGSYGSGSKGEKDGETGNIGKLKLLEIIKILLGVGLSIWENGKFFENILILTCWHFVLCIWGGFAFVVELSRDSCCWELLILFWDAYGVRGICQTGQFSLVFKTLAYNDSLCGVFVRNIWYLKLWPQILICSFSRVFQARGLKKHLKRLNAPKHWMLDKLGGAFVCTVLTVVDDIICHFYL